MPKLTIAIEAATTEDVLNALDGLVADPEGIVESYENDTVGETVSVKWDHG